MNVTAGFHALVEQIVDRALATDPTGATWIGDHRFDSLLPDWSAAGIRAAVDAIDAELTALDAVDDLDLDTADAVDLEICRAALQRQRFDLDELRRHEWDPTVWNPGSALYPLVAREVGPTADRAEALRGRVGAIADHLATARNRLGEMPAIHVETAIAQLAGTRSLLDGPIRELTADDAGTDTALRALDGFAAWLAARQATADRDPRLGPRMYAAALWHGLDDEITPADLLDRAYARLEALTDEMTDLAVEYLGARASGIDVIRVALDEIADAALVSDATVLREVERAVERTTRFVTERGLVTVPDLDVRVIEMPEVHRGVAVAYCDAPGPLESSAVPTFVAVSPTPNDWTPERVSTFYREYNAVQLHVLTVHEAVPGHVLQLARAATCRRPTRVRAVGRSGPFVEGWAVYAEHVVAAAGYRPDDRPQAEIAFGLQQRKMAIRSTINTILDIGVHAHDLDERGAMTLMRERGFQEEGEAAGKWRRALLTAGQLPTYFAGHQAVASIVDDLRVLHPDWSLAQVHDLVLSHGSPAPRHLRTLLGL